MNTNEILNLLFKDLSQVMIVYGIFACSFIANILFSIRLNVKYYNQKFEFKKLLDSLLNALCIIGGTLFLVSSIDLITIFSGVNGSQLGDLITVSVVLLAIGKATLKYITEAYNTLLSILEIEK